jgi:hypothetical protein
VTGDPMADVAAQIAREQADPTGSRVLATEVASGDLSDQAVRDQLRAGAEQIASSGLPE